MSTITNPSTSTFVNLNELTKELVFKKQHRYRRGDYVFLTQQQHQLYLLCQGQVKIGSYLPNGKAIIKDILGEGDLFGAVASPAYRSNNFAQVAADDTQLIIFSSEELPTLPEKVQAYLFRMMNRRIRRLEHQLESIAGRTVPYRVIDLLCRLAHERGTKVGMETLIRHGITHADIAMLIGTSRQTVSGILAKLRQDNFINYDRHRILIRDLSQLEALSMQEQFEL